MEKHSPLPWKVKKDKGGRFSIVEDGPGEYEIASHLDRDNAARIVQTCNGNAAFVRSAFVLNEQYEKLQQTNADLLSTLAKERDAFGKKETELLKTNADLVKALEIAKADILHFKETGKMYLYPTLEAIENALRRAGGGV